MTQHADFPDLRPGQSWSDTSAHQWRNLIDVVRAMSSLEVGDGLHLTKTADSWQLNLGASKPLIRQTLRKAVVLIEVPPEGPARDRPWLRVREVEYATAARTVEPPDDRDHPYRWRGVPFQAYPQIGRGPDEYFDALWDETGPPTLDATFLTATFDGAVWVLELPRAAGQTAMVVVRATEGTGSDRVIRVSEVKRTPEFPGDEENPAFDVSVQAFLANTWPPLRARHYRGFLWQGETVEDESNVLPAIQIGGAWWVQQQMTWGELGLQSSIPISDCQV